MKAKELIFILENLIIKHGNLQVGIKDFEFGGSFGIENIAITKSNNSDHSFKHDDESLLKTFIKIS